MKYHIYWFIFLFLIIAPSCKKGFLEVADKTVLLKEAYVTDLATTGHYLNGIYVTLADKLLNGLVSPYPEIAADNMKPIGNKFEAQYNWSQQAGAEGNDLSTLWMYGYQIIRSCNFVVERSDLFKNENQNKAMEFKGQALALRAYIHFILVNTFAQSYSFTPGATHLGIPYIMSSDIEPKVSRQTVAEVYGYMIEDLSEALQVLPTNFTSKQLMNRYATKALLARIYLFKGDYNEAKNVSKQVLNEVPLMNAGYPANLFTGKDSEAIFQMPPGASDNYYPQFIGYYSKPGSSSFSYVATNDIAQLLRDDMRDKRNVWVTSSSEGWIITKFPNNAISGFPYASGNHYHTFFRSSEMCLSIAEAYANLNMEDSARYFVDLIRLRANPDLSNISATGSALLDSIYRERRKEMSFENFRLFDLLRRKEGVYRLDANNSNAKDLPYPSDKAIAPIPFQDVKILGLQQNPGY